MRKSDLLAVFSDSICGPSTHGLVTDIQVNVYIGNKLWRLSFQSSHLLKIK